MSNNANAQAQLDNLRNVASQLKEMRHYAQSNIEHALRTLAGLRSGGMQK